MQSSLALQLPPKARQPSEIVWHTINEANAELGGKSAVKPGLYYSCLVSNRRVAAKVFARQTTEIVLDRTLMGV